MKRPRLTLDIDDSLESIKAPDGFEDEEEDSELPFAPTPSILPENNGEHSEIQDQPTFTLDSINYVTNAASPNANWRVSRRSFPASDPVVSHDADEDSTLLSERGRRVPTMDATENLSRYDFGDINIDEVHSGFGIGKDEDGRDRSKSPEKTQDRFLAVNMSYTPFQDGGGETEALRHLQDLHRYPSLAPPDESNIDILAIDNSNFQLPEPDMEATSYHANGNRAGKLAEASLSVSAEDKPGDSFVANPGLQAGLPADSDVEPEVVVDSEVEELETTQQSNSKGPKSSKPSTRTRRQKMKQTRHGEIVPSLPSSVIRRVTIQASERLGLRRPKLGRDHMAALEQATEWFFEQVGEDLAAYSDHAKRKKRIDQSDMLLLLRRQRLFQGPGELLKAAKELLPKDAFNDLNLEEVSDA